METLDTVLFFNYYPMYHLCLDSDWIFHVIHVHLVKNNVNEVAKVARLKINQIE